MSQSTAKPADSGVHGKRVRLLIVEDDVVDCEAIVRFLDSSPDTIYESAAVHDWAGARNLIEQEQFDAILLDVGLPDIDGLQAIQAIQDLDPSVPVVVYSGADDHDLALRAVHAGAQDFLLKSRADAVLVDRAVRYAIERKKSEQEMHRLAYYDSLTGVPNRVLLQDRLAQAIVRARRSGEHLALIYFDMDRFKDLNDSLGHTAGDEALAGFARRLKGAVRESDTVARIGGDEFVVLVCELSRPNDAAITARKILHALERPIAVLGQSLRIRSSAGIAVWPYDGETGEELIRSADLAMYHAKSEGGARYRFRSSSMREETDRHRQALVEFQNALDREEMKLRFQPLLDLTNRRVVGLAVRLRVAASIDGAPPFLPICPGAACSPMMAPIQDWTLREACAQWSRWRDEVLDCPPVSVRLPAWQLNDDELARTICRILEECDVPPQALKLEVDEGDLLLNEMRSLRSIRALHSMRIEVTLNRFGTGAVALSHLRKFPFAALKLDSSLVADLGQNPHDDSIAEGVGRISAGLGIRLAADGVHTPTQMKKLLQLGCEWGQGELLGPTVDAALVPDLLTQAVPIDA